MIVRLLPIFIMLMSASDAVEQPTISALDFGAVPNDSLPDDEAIGKALRNARAQGFSELRLPPGEYLISAPIQYVSGIDLVGAGCDRTTLKRSASSRGQMMFELNGTSEATVRGITFEYSSAPEFYRAIGFRGKGSEDISIADNCFSDQRPISRGGDRWAIELSAQNSPSRDIVITNNHVDGNMQLTAGGGAGVARLRIIDNIVIGAKANGIGISTLSDSAVFDDVEIRGNVILESASIGIFVGPDQNYAGGGIFRNINISDNHIAGLTTRFGYGIFLRASKGGFSKVSIESNSIEGGTAAKTTAIRLTDDHGEGQRQFSDIRLCKNDVRQFSRGIWLENAETTIIGGNTMATGRPYILDSSKNRDVRHVDMADC